MSDFQANLIKNSFVDNFRFTKAEDILFALEMNSESMYNLLYKRINGKFAKATVNTSIIEAIATVVLRCCDKDATEELYLINLLMFDSPEVDRWKCMDVCLELAHKAQVPKNLYDLEEMHQNELLFDDNNCVVGINTYNFIRDLQWKDAIPDSVFRFWDEKDLKEMLVSCMESNLFFMNSNISLTCSVSKHQGIIHLMLAMLKVRCSMALSQNEEEARKLLARFLHKRKRRCY